AIVSVPLACWSPQSSARLGKVPNWNYWRFIEWSKYRGPSTMRAKITSATEIEGLTREDSMRSERDKMLAGELYDPLDPELVTAGDRARDLCQALNATREVQKDERRHLLRELFGAGGESVWMQPPFFCDYGSNIMLGERVFFNFNCIVLDVCQVRIGDYTQ